MKTDTWYGYHGRYLRIDLTTGQVSWRRLSAERLRRYLGGCGLGTAILLAEQAALVDPLSPAAPLIFAFSPLVGSPLTTSAKFSVVGKSPLTGYINDAMASGRFALAGKRTGADAIVIRGQARDPSVLLVDNGQVRCEVAGDVWGSSTTLAERRLQERFGADFSFAVIGPAGERGVRFATISHDGRHAGRGGSGAVLGAKRIKAIGVRGTQTVSWADPTGLYQYATALSERSFGPATAKYRELGTASNLLLFNRLRALPTCNFQQGSFDRAASLAPEALASDAGRSRKSCVGCTIGCEHLFDVRRSDAKTAPADGVRVEYESLFALGSLCGIGRADVVLSAIRRCDEWGLDTISTGGTLAFMMECVQRGLVADRSLRFGNAEALLVWIDRIAFRRGWGHLLAEGSRRLAAHIGRDSERFAPHVKGLELPGYEPRALQTMALGFAVGTRGADHNRSGAYEIDFAEGMDRRQGSPGSARLAAAVEDRSALMDSLILCKFLRGVFPDLMEEAAQMLRFTTGWDVSAEELHQTARRIVDARKWFNIQAGWTPAEDTLPPRFLQEPLPDDPTAQLSPARLDAMKAAYYAARGWTDDGRLPGRVAASLACDFPEANASGGMVRPP